MIDMRYKPDHLPQLSAPYTHVLGELDKEGVEYKFVNAKPETLKPLQGLVSYDKISEIDPESMSPIWISQDMEILDGHHRYGSALTHEKPMKCIMVMKNQKDASRILNKIQDIFDYNNQVDVEEVVSQDQINNLNDPETSDFLSQLEGELHGLDSEDREVLHSGQEIYTSKPKNKKLSGYRKQDISEKSSVGNFFSLKPIDGYGKYEMDFDNLFDTNDIGLYFKNGRSPVEHLAMLWFPHIDFKRVAGKLGVDKGKLINKAVAEKAKKMGYDGIKYGDIMVQGL